ncbi:hypothetical protein FALBO_16454 [Fusarium albosuccineum]|uniref:Uncharacterized protein n=1 Tax=Fusarium albosuccineum TaxID=1237068 RepID=A0A8H4KJV3_9HYPO|nr:hypothetical protein FALBO_16454 [Fusarium albosuccineum]
MPPFLSDRVYPSPQRTLPNPSMPPSTPNHTGQVKGETAQAPLIVHHPFPGPITRMAHQVKSWLFPASALPVMAAYMASRDPLRGRCHLSSTSVTPLN